MSVEDWTKAASVNAEPRVDDKHLTLEQHERAWEVWDEAWDAARAADTAAGRMYDRRIYAERASEARNAYIRSCTKAST